MNKKNLSRTKSAFIALLMQLGYVVLTVLVFIACLLLEKPLNKNAIYGLFLLAFEMLFICYPICTAVVNGVSIYFQISALRNHESKLKNVTMFVIAILYQIAVIIFWILLFNGSLVAWLVS